MHKVYLHFHALVLQVFKLACKGQEKFVPANQIVVGDSVTLKNSHTSDEFAEIQPIFPRQEVSKESRTQTIDVLLKFPSFIASI